MKRYHLLPLLLLTMLACSSGAQDASDCYRDHLMFLEEQTAQFADDEESPLLEKDRNRFESINYYPYDEKYCIEARWMRTPDEESFQMATSTDRMPTYVKYGELHFTLDDEEVKMAVYQNPELSMDEEYWDYLFVPFNDLSNGETSYGGGRYYEMTIPEHETVLVNLNNTYHPYCAYNPKYSCPIPPEENMLDVRIEAGVMLGINGEKGEKY